MDTHIEPRNEQTLDSAVGDWKIRLLLIALTTILLGSCGAFVIILINRG
jgi:hypothetical protein